MEVFNKIQNNLNILSEISIQDLFPSDIYYPRQKKIEELEISTEENEDIILNSSHNFSDKISASRYSNINKINLNNFQDEISDELELPINNTRKSEKNITKKSHVKKSNEKKIVKNFKKLHFPNFTEIWDIIMDDEIVAFCGKNLIKVFFFKKNVNKSNLNNTDQTQVPNSEIININKIQNTKEKNISTIFANKEGDYELFDHELTFYDKDEEFYCLANSYIESKGQNCKILAIGGTKSIIKILNLSLREAYMSLYGHRNEIYNLKFHPYMNNILLSASKDFSIRIWNVKNGLQLVIFGGPKGHSAEVLSIDWHLSGDYFASSSIDNTVKIWEITHQIKEKISQSNKIETSFMLKKQTDNLNSNINLSGNKIVNNKDIQSHCNKSYSNTILSDRSNHSNKNLKINCLNEINQKDSKKIFKTLITTIPLYSCKSIHENYVDSIRFNGNFLISKSLDGVIKEWLPIFNKESDYHLILNCYTYDVQELVWFMKLGFDLDSKIIATGNTQGKLFIFKLNEEIENNSINDDFDYYYNNSYLEVFETGGNKLIRSIAVFQDRIVFGNNNGDIYFLQVSLN